MQTDKVGMKELDRHLGQILANAQKRPVAVYRHGSPWIWILPHAVWERPNPWGNMVPPNHPLNVLREHVDARLRKQDCLFERVALESGSSMSPDILLRIVILRVVHGIESDEYLREQLTYNMLCRWFVGLPQETARMDEAVRAVRTLIDRVEPSELIEELLNGAPLASFPLSAMYCAPDSDRFRALTLASRPEAGTAQA